jgi:hypothetical protein
MVHEVDEIAERPVPRMHAVIVGDVVAVVAVGRRIERLQPDTGDAETGQIVEPAGQALEVPDAVAAGILVGFDVETLDDGVLVPEVVD